MRALTIRTATLADLPALHDVFRRASLSNPTDRGALTSRPDLLILEADAVRHGRTRLAVDRDAGDRIVGFVSLRELGGGVVEVEDLFVDPDVHRQGIGAALMRDALDAAAARGATLAEVTANTDALAFYESQGFVAVGEVATALRPAPRMARDLGR